MELLVKNLYVSYTNKPVLKSLDLHAATGTINGIIGLNGSGKTTLLNALYGLLKIDSGSIEINGAKATKRQMAYLTFENFFYNNITGREYLALFKRNNSMSSDALNDLFKLPLDSVTETYSSGMKKKLALTGVLMQSKPVLIMDEPFNGLDMESCRILRSILLSEKEAGKTVIVTSHILETLTNLCDKIFHLEDGSIKTCRDKSDFVNLEKEIFESLDTRNEQLIGRLFKDNY